MPITFRTSANAPREWTEQPIQDHQALLEAACYDSSQKSQKIVQSSFANLPEKHICANQNGFVHAAYRAYSYHHHLRIRPEDVWFSILTQLSFYINANAEKLRHQFVAHKGQKELKVTVPGTIDTVDHGYLATIMTDEIHKNVVDKELQGWILPDFATTATDDIVTAAVIMMGSMQKYFAYEFELICGIPSVTLLGEKEDWEKIRRKLDKVDGWGEEAKEFSGRLKIVLDYFVLSFDEPESDKVKEFWGKIAHHKSMGSGPTWLSGWITAFCFWTEKGDRPKSQGFGSQEEICELPAANLNSQGGTFLPVDTKDIPEGYVSVPVKVNDNGKEYDTEMLAGSVGVSVTSSGDNLDEARSHSDQSPLFFVDDSGALVEKDSEYKLDIRNQKGLDTIQPVAGWWMYILKSSQPSGVNHPELV